MVSLDNRLTLWGNSGKMQKPSSNLVIWRVTHTVKCPAGHFSLKSIATLPSICFCLLLKNWLKHPPYTAYPFESISFYLALSQKMLQLRDKTQKEDQRERERERVCVRELEFNFRVNLIWVGFFYLNWVNFFWIGLFLNGCAMSYPSCH